MSLSGKDDGAFCQFEGCKNYDILPAKCGKCRKLFCHTHRTYDGHQCTENRDKSIPTCPVCSKGIRVPAGRNVDTVISQHIDAGCPAKDTLEAETSQPKQLNFCSFGDCSKNEAILMLCTFCGNNFCVKHRLPEEHRCKKYEQSIAPKMPHQPRKAKEAPKPNRQLLLKEMKFQNSIGKPFGSKAQEVMDNIVVAVFPPPLADPSVQTAAAGGGSIALSPCYMHFSPKWSVGRVLDAVCAQFNIVNKNNVIADEQQRLNLFRLKSTALMPTSVPFGELVEPRGDAMMLVTGSELPAFVVEQVVGHASSTEGKRSRGGGKTDCCIM